MKFLLWGGSLVFFVLSSYILLNNPEAVHVILLGIGVLIYVYVTSKIVIKSEIKEKTMSMVISTVSDAFVKLNRKFIITDCNPAFANMLSLDYGNMIGKKFTDFIDDDYIIGITDKILLGIKFESVLTRENRDKLPIIINSVSSPNMEYFVFITDITKQKEEEKNLRDDINHLHTLLDQAPVALLLSRPSDGKILYVNRKATELFRLTPELDRANLRAGDFYVDPGKRLVMIEEIQNKGQIDNFEVELRKADNSSFWVMLAAQIIDYNHERTLLVACQDISVRKNLEFNLHMALSELEAIFENAAEGIAFLRNRKFVHINRKMQELFGYSDEEIKGITTESFYPTNNDYEEFGKEAYSKLSQGLTYTKERQMRRKDGSLFWCRLSGSMLDINNNERGSIWILEDIGERKKDQEKIDTLLSDLQKSNAELEQFAYVVSHDLREPLRMVSSYLSLLERKYKDRLDDDACEFISFARDGAIRMDKLIIDLLEYSRVGRRSKITKNIDCKKVIDTAISNLQLRIEESKTNIEITTSLPLISADEGELVRLFQNLILNSITYRHHERIPNVKIMIIEKEEEWLFSVSDNGIGILPEHRNRVFHIFQRLHDRSKYPGTGIGLSICKKIAEHHGGRIWIEGDPSQGSIFSFTIPKD